MNSLSLLLFSLLFLLLKLYPIFTIIAVLASWWLAISELSVSFHVWYMGKPWESPMGVGSCSLPTPNDQQGVSVSWSDSNIYLNIRKTIAEESELTVSMRRLDALSSIIIWKQHHHRWVPIYWLTVIPNWAFDITQQYTSQPSRQDHRSSSGS